MRLKVCPPKILRRGLRGEGDGVTIGGLMQGNPVVVRCFVAADLEKNKALVLFHFVFSSKSALRIGFLQIFLDIVSCFNTICYILKTTKTKWPIDDYVFSAILITR
jgi:hypothetical protein